LRPADMNNMDIISQFQTLKQPLIGTQTTDEV